MFQVLQGLNFLLSLQNEHQEDRNVHTVDRDDGELRGVEAEKTENRSCEVSCIEVEEPACAEKKAEYAGV